MTRGEWVRNLPIEQRRKILEDNGGGDQLARDLGILPEGKRAKPKASRSRKAGVAGITFDSEGERDTFLRLHAEFPAVFVHPKIALSLGTEEDRGASFGPDFIVVTEVYPDGSFRAWACDHKGERKRETRKTAHVERDWAVRRKWLRESTGIAVRIITKSLTDLRACLGGGG